MNLYEYQRSRSFIDLGPRSLRFNILKLFSLETARQVETKFHVRPPWDRGMKIYSNGPGHLTSVDAMPIYCKNLKKSSSQEQKGQWPRILVCSIGYSSTNKFVQLMTLGCPWPILRHGQIWFYAFVWEKDFPEFFLVYDIKIGRCSQLNKNMNLYEYQRSRSFIDICPRSLRFNIFKLLFLKKSLGRLKPNFIFSLHELFPVFRMSRLHDLVVSGTLN